MNWLTIAWSMCASASIMLGLMHLLLWFNDRRTTVYLLSSLMALSAGAGAMIELGQLHAESVSTYGMLLRWQNLAVFLILVPMVWFIYLHFGTARRWMAITITSLWGIALAVNFLSPNSLVFQEIHRLESQTAFWGDPFTTAAGTANPWAMLAHIASLLIVIYTLDATLRAWRQGAHRRTVTIGAAMALFIVSAGVHAPLVDFGVVATPYMISFAFLAIVIAMTWELVSRSQDAAHLARDLDHTRTELGRLARVNLLGELASALAHELNQPLTAILSNAQAARRFLDSDSMDPAELREIIDDIVRDDKRAGEMIHRLRAMLRKGKVTRERFNLNKAVREVIGLFEGEAAAREIVVRFTPQVDLPVVNAGRIEVQQVVMNLLSNALRATSEYTPREPGIVVRTGQLNDVVAVSVSDNGPGIAAERQTEIFDPFVTSKAQGIGMGLTICRRIVEAHGGTIGVRNRPGGGTEFTFTLPPTGENG